MSTLAVAGDRSLRDLRLSLGRLTVVTGGNGRGKSSLHRALRLLAAIPQGGLVRATALEGGLLGVVQTLIARGRYSTQAATLLGACSSRARRAVIAGARGVLLSPAR